MNIDLQFLRLEIEIYIPIVPNTFEKIETLS